MLFDVIHFNLWQTAIFSENIFNTNVFGTFGCVENPSDEKSHITSILSVLKVSLYSNGSKPTRHDNSQWKLPTRKSYTKLHFESNTNFESIINTLVSHKQTRV